MRALVIDDSRTTRAILGKMLRDLGFEVHEAGNGCEGLEQLRQLGPVDVALVDWNLPVMNGIEFVRSVRAEPAYAAMRLMMVTTETEREQVSRALQEGANEYVMKPFTRDVIAAKLTLLNVSPW